MKKTFNLVNFLMDRLFWVHRKKILKIDENDPDKGRSERLTWKFCIEVRKFE